jgi:MtN3 and saliva related transmembrane protein
MIYRSIGIIAALLTMFGFLPQVGKIIRTKSARDVSLLTLLQFSLGVFLWMLYGVHLRDAIIIIANTVTFLTLIVALALYIKYR